MQEKDCKIIEVLSVLPGSIAEEAGIEAGDKILSINGQTIGDIFDYRFLTSEEELLVEISKPDGDVWEVEIEKEQYEDIGIDFENSMLDDARSCTNKCIFCFIDQLPKGMRETLYFKDDDSRLSFLTGNYVTLTNMKDDDIDRIVKYKMSPINVSVHTTNPELRVLMLKNRFAGNILKRIEKLVEAGITVNCQIVACRGINDGIELDKSIEDLGRLYPGVSSISIVPVGITRYRQGLYKLSPYDAQASKALIEQVNKWQKIYIEKFGVRLVYAADEFYIMAGMDIPVSEEYEDFPQIENGVGLVALLRQETYSALSALGEASIEAGVRSVSIATGVSAFQYISELAAAVGKSFKNLEVNVYEIKNNFFGENVTVTGLLTGTDLIAQLKGKKLGEALLISKSMLRAGEQVFLDDYTVDMLEKALKVKVIPVENTGKDFVEKILGIEI